MRARVVYSIHVWHIVYVSACMMRTSLATSPQQFSTSEELELFFLFFPMADPEIPRGYLTLSQGSNNSKVGQVRHSNSSSLVSTCIKWSDYVWLHIYNSTILIHIWPYMTILSWVTSSQSWSKVTSLAFEPHHSLVSWLRTPASYQWNFTTQAVHGAFAPGSKGSLLGGLRVLGAHKWLGPLLLHAHTMAYACGNHDFLCSIAATNDYHHYILLLSMITNDSWLIINDKWCSSMTRFASARGTWENTNEETEWCEGWKRGSKIQLSFPETMSMDLFGLVLRLFQIDYSKSLKSIF